jgi:TolB protein
MLILNQKDRIMYKILLLLSLVFSSVFAEVDANLEVVKKTNALPKILVSVATDTSRN